LFPGQGPQNIVDEPLKTTRYAEHHDGSIGVNGAHCGDPVITLDKELEMGNMSRRDTEKSFKAPGHGQSSKKSCNISNIGSAKDQGGIILLLTEYLALLIYLMARRAF
jgi:hypothetical protein